MRMDPRGFQYEDFEVGMSWKTAARTIGEADVAAFAGLTGDYTYLHTDAEGAANSFFGERIAHGLLGLSILTGLLTRLGILERTIEAFLGLEWSFRRAIRFGDTVHGTVEVRDMRISSKGKGLVTYFLSLQNQSGDTVQDGTFTIMVERKEAGEGDGAQV